MLAGTSHAVFLCRPQGRLVIDNILQPVNSEESFPLKHHIQNAFGHLKNKSDVPDCFCVTGKRTINQVLMAGKCVYGWGEVVFWGGG